jgi:peroxiredoxin
MRTALLFTLCAASAFQVRAAMEIGKPAPAFTCNRPGSTPITLSQYKGKVVAMAFISTTCPHCQNLTKVLNGIEPQYATKGVQFLACAFNDEVQKAGVLDEFIKQFQPTFPVGQSTRNDVIGFLRYSVMESFYVPHMVFIDRRGLVARDIPGEDQFFTAPDPNIRAELDKLLKPASVSARAAKTEKK